MPRLYRPYQEIQQGFTMLQLMVVLGVGSIVIAVALSVGSAMQEGELASRGRSSASSLNASVMYRLRAYLMTRDFDRRLQIQPNYMQFDRQLHEDLDQRERFQISTICSALPANAQAILERTGINVYPSHGTCPHPCGEGQYPALEIRRLRSTGPSVATVPRLSEGGFQQDAIGLGACFKRDQSQSFVRITLVSYFFHGDQIRHSVKEEVHPLTRTDASIDWLP